MTSAPTLTSATFVPESFPDKLSKNSAYGNPQARWGSVVSRAPAPGTITASCRRTQDAVRTVSMPLPRTFRRLAVTPVFCCSNFWYQNIGTASMPYLARTRSGPPHMESTTASGWASRR